VDLRVARVGEGRALLVRPPDGRRIAALGVGGEIKDVTVAAGAEQHGVCGVRLDLAGHHVARHDSAGAAVHHDQLQHLVAVEHLDLAEADLARQRLVGAEQQLLPGLAARA